MTASQRPPTLISVDYDPFAGGALARVVPTTEPQREVWLADQLGRDASLAFNESVSLHLRGKLDVEALREGVRQLVERHDALRSAFGPDGETLCVMANTAPAWQVVDLASESARAREDAIAQYRRDAVETPFSLESGQLFRAQLLRLSTDEHVLMLTAHHIVCDGWSWWLMVRELATLYAQHSGTALPDLPLAPSFADYALDQAVHPGSATFAADEAYWLSTFSDGAPVLELPTDRPRPARRSFASKRIDHTFDAALLADIKRMGAKHGASLFATLLAGFASLLSRLAGQTQAVVGIPAAGQSQDGHDGLVGHCVNLLPLRFELDPALAFSKVVGQAQSTLLDAIEHQGYTFGTLLKKLRVDRDPSRLPLVSVMFNIDQALDQEAGHFPGLAMEFASNPRSYENFELFINAVQAHGELRLECQYNTDLFDDATVRRWLQAYETMLRAAAVHADHALGRLPLLRGGEIDAMRALQPARTAYDAGRLMHQSFEAQCDREPARIALRFGDRALRYDELDARANRIARLLRKQGVRRGSLVGLSLDRGIDMLAALLGILKSGAAYVPLDPAFPEERLSYMVGDAGLAALVTQSAHAKRFDLRGRPVLVLDTLQDELAATADTRIAADAQTAEPESPAYVIYTSGSTGKPKGVQVPHRAVSNFIAAMQARPGIGADDKLVAVTTLSFDIAVLELMLPLSVGAEVVLADRDTAIEGNALAALLTRSGATMMQATPATWRLLIEAGWRGKPDFTVLCGGEPLPVDLAQALRSRSGAVWNLYGPTETTVWSTCWRVEQPERGISIGTPIANTTVWILDTQGQPCPLGVPGEICIGGDGVTLGYLGREDLTAERFIADPFDGGDRQLYRTGDRGRWRADGMLEHLGRLDFQVKVRGYRIELGEIETALMTQAEIAQAVVLVREDRPGDVRLVAYVVAETNATPDEPRILQRLKGSLPDYMIPQHLVALAALPLLPNGKIDRKSLPAPDAGSHRSHEIVAPRNDLERAIATAMAQVLGVAELGIHDNFFAMGGHSLLAAQLTSRLNRELGRSLSLRALFDAPTVARLADAIGNAGDADAPEQRAPIPHRADQSRAPLALIQERLHMLEEFNPGQLTYNTPSAHRLTGPLDLAAFDRAFRKLMQRQSVLRTSIGYENGEPVQIVHEGLNPGFLPVIDLTATPVERREQLLAERLQAMIEVPFQLDDKPLFRARMFKMDRDAHVLFFMPHHIIWDGWSFDLMYADLSELYAAEVEQRAPSLPDLPVTYGDYAVWHREWAQGPGYAAQLAFWRKQLGGDREAIESGARSLPTDLPRRPGMSGRGEALGFQIDKPLTQALRAIGLREDATLFITLLTAYYILLAGVTGQRDLIVATPVRGRNSAEVEGLMGYFTNLLPLRVKLDPTLPFADALRRTKAAVLDSFANPDIRLEDISRELSLRSSAGAAVLYQTLFSLQDIRHRTARWGNVDHERFEVTQPGATEDLGLWFIESERGLAARLVYNADILFEQTAQLLQSRYLAILQAIARDPAQSIEAITRFEDGHDALIGRGPGAAGDVSVSAAAAAARSNGQNDFSAARGEDPRVDYLRTLWSELLGVAVAPDDNFFELGGNSMLAVQMANRVARDTGVRIKLMRLVAQTLAQIATELPGSNHHIPAPDGGQASDSLGPRIARTLRQLFRGTKASNR